MTAGPIQTSPWGWISSSAHIQVLTRKFECDIYKLGQLFLFIHEVIKSKYLVGAEGLQHGSKSFRAGGFGLFYTTQSGGMSYLPKLVLSEYEYISIYVLIYGIFFPQYFIYLFVRLCVFIHLFLLVV